MKKVNLKIGDSGNDADSFVSVDQEGSMASIIGISDTVILRFHWLANASVVSNPTFSPVLSVSPYGGLSLWTNCLLRFQRKRQLEKQMSCLDVTKIIKSTQSRVF